MYRIQVFI